MNVFVSEQLYIFRWAVMVGALIGLFYDSIRIFRRIVPHKRTIVGIEDLFFWFITGFIVFGYIFNVNDGRMRGFIFIGLSLGASLYFLLISSMIVRTLTTILKSVINVIKKVLQVLFTPITCIIKRCHIFSKSSMKGLKKTKRWLIIRIRQIGKEIWFIIKKI